MFLRTSNKTVYYPISRTRETDLVRGSGRVRYSRLDSGLPEEPEVRRNSFISREGRPLCRPILLVNGARND